MSTNRFIVATVLVMLFGFSSAQAGFVPPVNEDETVSTEKVKKTDEVPGDERDLEDEFKNDEQKARFEKLLEQLRSLDPNNTLSR